MTGAPGPAALARMDREGAVGWRDIALDGLTCYHRCIEAMLRGHGFTALEVTEELGGAVTDRLGLDGRPQVRLRASVARWRLAPPGGHRWDDLRSLLDDGESAVVWPDGYFWPGDSCEGRRHIHHHAVLATGIENGCLRYLDIDADEADGFARVIPVTAQLRQACTRLLDLPSVRRGPPLVATAARHMVVSSVRPLARFADGADQLARWWAPGPSRRMVHAADLWVLGDIQPQLYLLSCIGQRFGYGELAERGFAAAAQAKKISLFLFGLHQYKPRAPYDLCRDDIELLASRLRAVAAAAAAAGLPAPRPTQPAASWLWGRLDTLAQWHFGAGLGKPPGSGLAHTRPAGPTSDLAITGG